MCKAKTACEISGYGMSHHFADVRKMIGLDSSSQREPKSVLPKEDVRLEEKSVWPTQQHIAELFQTSIPNEEGELEQKRTIKKFLTVRQEGNREVKRQLDYYNLDMIISVGYRVKSH